MSGLEIFGAVTAALGCMQQAYEFINTMRAAFGHLKEAGLEIEQIHDKLATTKARLDAWARLWYVSDSTPPWIFEGFWGEKNSVLVQRDLYKISTESQRVLNKIYELRSPQKREELLRRAQKAAQSAQKKGVKQRASDVFGMFDQISRKDISKWKRIKYLFEGPDDLLGQAQDIERMFVCLNCSTNEFFEAQHRQTLGNLEGLQRVRPAVRAGLLNLATETLGTSAVAYKACATLYSTILPSFRAVLQETYIQKAFRIWSQVPRYWGYLSGSSGDEQFTSEDKCMLELREDLERVEAVDASGEGINLEGIHVFLDFYLSFPTAAGLAGTDLVIQGPREADPTTPERLATAYDQYLVEGSSFFKFKEKFYGIMRPDHLGMEPSPARASLQNLFSKLNAISVSPSPSSEYLFLVAHRRQLALRLCRFGLVLLGSLWLDGTSSKDVWFVEAEDKRSYRCMLGRATFPFESVLHDENKTETSMFHLGVILAELALGQGFTSYTAMPQATGRGWIFTTRQKSLVLGSPGLSQQSQQLLILLDDVKAKMGATYGEIVELCLQLQTAPVNETGQKKKALHRAVKSCRGDQDDMRKGYKQILGLYYHGVYLKYAKQSGVTPKMIADMLTILMDYRLNDLEESIQRSKDYYELKK